MAATRNIALTEDEIREVRAIILDTLGTIPEADSEGVCMVGAEEARAEITALADKFNPKPTAPPFPSR